MKQNCDHPKVSVILPTFNRANTLGRSIRSVLDQTYYDLELIVVDDASTDNTKEVVKKFDDKRIHYIKHNVNKGAASAMNTGIRAANGCFISIQNSDDFWLSEKIENEIKSFTTANSKVGVVYSKVCQVYKKRRIYVPSVKVKKKDGNIHNELLKGNFITGLSLIRKECFEKVGLYDETLPSLEDWELYIRISKYYDFKYMDKPLIIAELSQDSLSVKPSIFIKSTKIILEKHENKFIENTIAAGLNYGYIGSWLCLDGQLREGRSYFIKAIKLYHWHIKFYFAFLISLFGKKIYKQFLNLNQRTKIY
jgi:glycosyltransferase involved in cell wall biosynthesis